MRTFIACDPGWSSLGLCLVEEDKITKSFTITSKSICFAIRCQEIARQIFKLRLPELQYIYIEVLNGSTNYRTHWGTGAILTGLANFCTEKTKIIDKTSRFIKMTKMKTKEDKAEKRSLLLPPMWQHFFDVEDYGSNDKDKDDKIIRAFRKHFPNKQIDSADEAVAIFLATLIIEKEDKQVYW